jgi:superfamily II DNA or RNA helicase
MHPVEGNPEFFGRPFSAINRKLFTYAQIVGAGKTLGMFSLPFAINACAHPNAPRIDKMLIVSKNSSLVSQIANELEHEPVDYGIVSEAPRVSVIDSAAKMFGEASDHDIAVMCPNMLWPNRDMASAEDVIVTWHPASADMMRRYPLIIFDEMHYAYDNIRRLLPIATNSLVFGFTATPIDGAGDLLNDIVLMSVYGYRDAQINDGSMMKLNYTATH